jgi:hypothetical protein
MAIKSSKQTARINRIRRSFKSGIRLPRKSRPTTKAFSSVFDDRKTMELIASHLQKFRLQHEARIKNPYDLRQLVSDERLIRQRHLAARKEIQKKLPLELATTYVALISIASQGCEFRYWRGKKPIPEGWLGRSKRDPNWTFAHLLLSLADHLLGVLYLCQSGLDASARILSRSVKELLDIGLVIVSDPNMMKKYLALNALKDQKQWQQSFTRGKIAQAISALLLRFGVSEKIVAEAAKRSRWDYAFLSKVAHGSRLATVLSAYVMPLNNRNVLRLGLYGAPSQGIRSTLGRLNHDALVFNAMLWRILYDIHGFRLRRVSRWESYFALTNLHSKLVHDVFGDAQ